MPPAPDSERAARRPWLAAVVLVTAGGGGLTWWLASGPGTPQAPETPASGAAAGRFSQNRVFSSADVTIALKALYQAADRYANDHNGVLPSMANSDEIRDALARYLQSPDLLLDPRVNQPLVARPAVGRQRFATVRSLKAVMFCGATEGTDGMRTAIDGAGNVRAVPPEECR